MIAMCAMATDTCLSVHVKVMMISGSGSLSTRNLLSRTPPVVLQVVDGSSLLDAAAHGHVDVVKYLLSNKADTAATWVSAGHVR